MAVYEKFTRRCLDGCAALSLAQAVALAAAVNLTVMFVLLAAGFVLMSPLLPPFMAANLSAFLSSKACSTHPILLAGRGVRGEEE